MIEMLRRSVLVVVVGVLLVALPGGASGRTADVSFSWAVASLPGAQKWIRIANTDDANSIALASVHGIDFNIVSVASVRASGGPTPSCAVSTVATTFDYLYCNGQLPPDSSVIIVVNTTGSGQNFEVAASDSLDTSTLDYAPDTVLGPILSTTATLTTNTTTRQVTFTSGANAYDEVEILPQGLTVTKVDSITPAGSECDPEGPGLDCTVDLPPNTTGTITFEATDSSAATPTADVILTGDDGFGDNFVTQTQGKPAAYDLVTKAQPKVVTYKRGKKAAAHPIRFTVSNAGSATLASAPVTVTETVSGSAAKLFHAKLSCQPTVKTMPALQPGKSATACALAFSPASPLARAPGKLNVTLAVACKAPETNCANNRARATIVIT